MDSGAGASDFRGLLDAGKRMSDGAIIAIVTGRRDIQGSACSDGDVHSGIPKWHRFGCEYTDSHQKQEENEYQSTPESHFRFQRSSSIPLPGEHLVPLSLRLLLRSLLLPLRLMIRWQLIHITPLS